MHLRSAGKSLFNYVWLKNRTFPELGDIVYPCVENVSCVDDVWGYCLYRWFPLQAFTGFSESFCGRGPCEKYVSVWYIAKAPVKDYIWIMFLPNHIRRIGVGIRFKLNMKCAYDII